MGNLIGRIIEGGIYFSGIRRWSWQRFRCKGESSLRIATLYRPVPPATGGVSGSVYAQHLTHFHNINRLKFPIVAFLEELGKEIESRKEKGYRIIIMGDINEYILSHNIIRCMANLELTEMVTNKHGEQGPG